MFEGLNSFFVIIAGKTISGKISKNEPEERKKCKNCLKRVGLDNIRCPYCGYGDFHFDNN